MIDAAAISEILKIYDKHGWKLRRVLLSHALKARLNVSAGQLFGDSQSTDSDIDAAWFSRASGETRETWEIRHLGETPFALLEVIDIAVGETERDAILSDTENRLREKVAVKRAAM